MSTALFLCFDEAIVNVKEILTIKPYWTMGVPNTSEPAGVKVAFKNHDDIIYIPDKTIRQVADAIVRLD